MTQKLIPIIDAGHGVETPGKRSPIWPDGRQLFEWEFNRDITKRIARLLDAAGIKYHILVPEDHNVPLAERCRRANRINIATNGQCFLLSIHANAGGGTGYEVYTTPGETKSDAMATTLFNCMKRDFVGWKMRADRSDGDDDKESQLYILKHTACPAMLSENFFMDNKKDCDELFKNEFRERIAKAHAIAIKQICLI